MSVMSSVNPFNPESPLNPPVGKKLISALDPIHQYEVAAQSAGNYKGNSAFLVMIQAIMLEFIMGIFYLVFDLIPTFRVAWPVSLWLIAAIYEWLIVDSGFAAWSGLVTYTSEIEIGLTILGCGLVTMLTATPTMAGLILSGYAKNGLYYAYHAVHLIAVFDFVTDYEGVSHVCWTAIYPHLLGASALGDYWLGQWFIYLSMYPLTFCLVIFVSVILEYFIQTNMFYIIELWKASNVSVTYGNGNATKR